jgi:hypothetical protein
MRRQNMRHISMAMRRRQARRAANGATGLIGHPRLLLGWLRQLSSRPGLHWAVIGVVALLAVAGLVASRPATHAQARQGQLAALPIGHILARAQPPAALPAVGRWTDPAHGTAYTVRLQSDVTPTAIAVVGRPGTFTFATPKGEQIQGFAGLARQPDNAITQVPPSGTPAQCGKGIILTDAGTAAVVFTLRARFDQYALVAYATISYALSSDQQGFAAVCLGDGTPPFTYVMASGCTPDTCTDALTEAGPAVTGYDTTVVAAAQHGGAAWDAVYVLTARTITGQYTREQFAAALDQQAGTAGRIRAISEPTSPPEVVFDAAGQAYFAVAQTVTTQLNGATTDHQVTTYYLLEGGQWLFWFTA